MAFRLRVSRVEDLLRDVLRHNLVEHVVRGQRQRLLVHEQTFRQQSVQIMRRHNVVLSSGGEWAKEGRFVEWQVNFINQSVMPSPSSRLVYCHLLVCAARQEEAEQLQRLQPDQLAFGGEQLENGPHAVLHVERGHHRAGVLGHQRDEHLQHVVQVLVLVHCRQVVENALQLVLLHPVADHNQLLEEQQNVRTNGQDVLLRRPWTVQALGHDATLRSRIHDPVVELERVHRLQDRADPAHIAVDLRVAEELGGQVGVEARLHVGRRVDPQRGIEEDMVQQLPR